MSVVRRSNRKGISLSPRVVENEDATTSLGDRLKYSEKTPLAIGRSNSCTSDYSEPELNTLRKRKGTLFVENSDNINENNDIPAASRINDFFTDFIPTYFCGAKAFKFNSAICVCAIFWSIYLVKIFEEVLWNLKVYYVDGKYIPEIAKLTLAYRISIAISYLLIDAMYPISFVLLIFFYRMGNKFCKQLVIHTRRSYLS